MNGNNRRNSAVINAGGKATLGYLWDWLQDEQARARAERRRRTAPFFDGRIRKLVSDAEKMREFAYGR